MASDLFNPLLGCLGLSIPILAGDKVSTRGMFLYLKQAAKTATELWVLSAILLTQVYYQFLLLASFYT